MIVYVESNFILELAYLQEEHDTCRRVLNLANQGRIHLVVPAFSVTEPYSAWIGRKKRRQHLHGELNRELRELGRSAPYVDSREDFQDVTKTLLASAEEEKFRLDAAIEEVIRSSSLAPIEGETMLNAIEIQKTRGLSPQDSIVYAAVLSHLSTVDKAEVKVFVTRNSKDFANPDIVAELKGYECELCTNFGAAYGLILRGL